MNRYEIDVQATVKIKVQVNARSEDEAYEKADSRDYGYLKAIVEKLNEEQYETEIHAVNLISRIEQDPDDANGHARDLRLIHKEG